MLCILPPGPASTSLDLKGPKPDPVVAPALKNASAKPLPYFLLK